MGSSSNPPEIDTRILIHTGIGNQAKLGPNLCSDEDTKYITSDEFTYIQTAPKRA